MNFIQNTLQLVEVGRAQVIVRIVPLLAALLVVGGAYNMMVYHGLNDSQSMDNAQLARQIARGQGFTTEFLRPQALGQLRNYPLPHELFPASQFPAGAPRIIPDTYNAPAYPYLLAAWFRVTHPDFGQVATSMSASHMYAPDRYIPLLNQIFMILTGILVFALGRRLFDDRVAWMSLVAFLGTDLVWHYNMTALSTSLLMFLVTAALMCALEIVCVSEACFENEDISFAPAYWWGLALAVLIGVACLTRLQFLVLLVPIFIALGVMPRSSFPLLLLITLIVVGMVAPWFLHVYRLTGNPLGSNFALMLSGQSDYSGNQIYCTTSIPDYEHLFANALKKEFTGFRWHLEHGWGLLGSNVLTLMFAASLLHQFRRRRTRYFQWLVMGAAIILIAANNFGSSAPDPIDPWNVLIILLPCMLVIGSAFFFILLDRLNLQVKLLNSVIVTTTIAVIISPLMLTLTSDSNLYYNFPPYMPPLIKALAQYSEPDEWVTTDMPWATAWYADRPSLWLPDSLAEFQNFHDNVCPTGILLLTPVSWTKPFNTFTTGEYKDWNPLISSLLLPSTPPPPNFPLSVHTMTAPGGPDYYIWSDRPRWQQR